MEPVDIDDSVEKVELGKNIDLLEDPYGEYTIDAIDYGVLQHAFSPSERHVSGFGFTNSVIWIRFSLNNKSGLPSELYLDIQNPLLDEVDLFVPSENGYYVELSGDHVPFGMRTIKYRTVVFPVKAYPGINSYFLRVKAKSNMNLPLTLWSPRTFSHHLSTELPLLWMFYGLMFAMIIYNIFLYISTRDLNYLYYLLFIMSFIIFRFAYNGFAIQYLWQDNQWWADVCIPFFIAATTAFFILFTRLFLNTRQLSRMLDDVLLTLSAVFFLLMVLSLVIDYHYSIQVTLGFCLLTIPLLMFSGILALCTRSRESVFYLMAWTIFLVGSVLNILHDFSVLPTNFIMVWSQQIGAAIQVLILSLGLADRINRMRGEIVSSHEKLMETYNNLDQERELLSVTLESIADAVISIDLDGRIVLMNTIAQDLTGYSQSQGAGTRIEKVFNPVSCTHNPPECISRILNNKGQIDFSREDIVISRDGTLMNVHLRCSPIKDCEGREVGIVLVFSDITDKLKYEQEIIKSSKLDAIGTLAGGIAHDFNNVLTAIVGNISLAKLKCQGHLAVCNLLNDTETATYRAKDLTQQLLTFSKGGAPIRSVANIKSMLTDVIQFNLSGSNVVVDIDLQEDLWSASIDEGQMSQVIGNMIINAKQAMPEGGRIWVKALNEYIESGRKSPAFSGKFLRISIRDEGCGIPADKLENIFDPFYTTKPDGNGLGLASSYSIIRNHEGLIDVQSQVGEGTEFIIYLPATDEKPHELSENEEEIKRGSGRILYMDDEDIILRSIGGLITSLGYDVDCVHNGFEAVQTYRQSLKNGRSYDLVLVDLTIPGSMGGKDTVQKILEMDPYVKAVATSGYSNDPVMANYRHHGFVDIIVKPYTLKILSHVIHRALCTHPKKTDSACTTFKKSS